MTEHESAASRRARLPRCAGRALLLTGVGAGLWLLGSYGSTASAEESAPAPVPMVSLASGLLAPVGDALPPVVDHAVAPIGERLVVPVVVVPVVTSVVTAVVTPVVEDVVVPIVHPVIEDVVEPIVADVVAPVGTPVLDPVVGALDPAGTPVGEVAVVTEHLPQGAALVDAPQASPATRGAAPVALSADSQIGPATLPATAPVPTPPAGPTGLPGTAPAPSTSSGSSSGEQTPADLSSVPRTVPGAALVAATGAGSDAAGTTSFDPTFSPD
jgi:hypothetical protein